MDPARGRHGRLLLAILLVALAIRLATVGFGLPGLNDPDELMFEGGALHMLRSGTPDPGWFGHPATITMYALALLDAGAFGVAWLTGRAPTPRTFGDLVYHDPGWIILPGRIAEVLVAIGVIWLTGRLAARLFGPRAGLVAAALLALDPVHVTWSQIIRGDMTACLFTLLCLGACVDIAGQGAGQDAGDGAGGGSWRNHARAALWLGLAIASKWPFALAALSIAGASAVAVRAGVLTRAQAFGRLAATGAGAVAVLFASSPYLLIRWPVVLRNLHGEGQAQHLGATGGSVWYNLWWYASGALWSGFGAVGLALVVLGAATLPRHRVALAVLAPLGLAFLLLLGVQSLVWERWALPLLPLGAIVAALGVERLAELVSGPLTRPDPAATPDRTKTGGHATPRAARLAVTAVLVAALAPLAWHCWGDSRARTDDTRQRATAWARANVPRGSRLLIEHYGFDLVGQGWTLLFPVGEAGCVDVDALIGGRINLAGVERARGGRSNVDYGTMAPARRADCRPDFAILAQMDRYRAERERFPREDAAYRALAATGRQAAVFAPVPGRVGGPLVRVFDFRRGEGQGSGRGTP